MMRNQKRFFYPFLFLFFLFLFLFGIFNEAKGETNITEEAFPIREGEDITSLHYVISIPSSMKDDSITVSSHILDSIFHYKEVDSIEQFPVELEIQNHSSYDYLLKDVSIVPLNGTSLIEDISYEKNLKRNIISFVLSRDFLLKYDSNYQIQIELEK